MYFSMIPRPSSVSSHNEVAQMLFCRQRNSLITVDKNGKFCFWDPQSGDLKYCINYSSVLSVAVHSSGLYMFLGLTHCIHCCKFQYKNVSEEVTFPFFQCTAIAYSACEQFIAFTSGSFNVYIYDTAYFEQLHVLKRNTSQIKKLVWSYKDHFLVSLAVDGSINRWCIEDGERETCLAFEGMDFADIEMSKDRNILLAVGNSDNVKILDLDTNEIKSIVIGNKVSSLASIDISNDNRFLLVGSADGQVVSILNPLESIVDQKIQFYANVHTSKVTHIKISPENDIVATNCTNGMLMFWDVKHHLSYIGYHPEKQIKKSKMRSPYLIEKRELVHMENTIRALVMERRQIPEAHRKERTRLQVEMDQEYEQTEQMYENHIKKIQQDLFKRSCMSDQEISLIRENLTKFECILEREKAELVKVYNKFRQNIVEGRLEVQELERKIQLETEIFERAKEEMTKKFRNDMQTEKRTACLMFERRQKYIQYLDGFVKKTDLGAFQSCIEKQMTDMETYYSNLLGKINYKNYALKVRMDHGLKEKEKKLQTIHLQNERLVEKLKHLNDKKEIVKKQIAPYLGQAVEGKHGEQIFDLELVQLKEITLDLKEMIDFFELEFETITDKLCNKDHHVQSSREEIMKLENNLLQANTKLSLKHEKLEYLQSRLEETEQNRLSSHKESARLVKHIENIMQDLYDVLHKHLETKLVGKCGKVQTQNDLSMTYKIFLEKYGEKNFDDAKNFEDSQAEFCEQKLFLNMKIEVLKTTLKEVDQTKRGNTKALEQQNWILIQENRDVRSAISELNTKIEKFKVLAKFDDSLASRRAYDLFLASPEDIVHLYAEEIYRKEQQVEILREKIIETKAILSVEE